MTVGSSWRIGLATKTQTPSVPTAAAIAQPNCSVGPTRMPTSSLDSRFDDTARNASPILVVLSNSVSPPAVANTVISVKTVYHVRFALPTVSALPEGNSSGKRHGSKRQMIPAIALITRNKPSVMITSGK